MGRLLIDEDKNGRKWDNFHPTRIKTMRGLFTWRTEMAEKWEDFNPARTKTGRIVHGEEQKWQKNERGEASALGGRPAVWVLGADLSLFLFQSWDLASM